MSGWYLIPGAVQIMVKAAYLGPGHPGSVCSAEKRQQWVGGGGVVLSAVTHWSWQQ